MPSSTQSHKSKVIPLEYCTPERAATLLDCQVGDIYHWAGIGAIDLYLDASGYEFSTGQHLRAVHVFEYAQTLQHGASCMVPDDFAPPGEYCLELGYIGHAPAILRGLWRLPSYLPQSWQSDGCVELDWEDAGLSELFANKNGGGEDDVIAAYFIEVDPAALKKWTFILRNDLLLLERHIAIREPLKPKLRSQPDAMVAAMRPNMRSVTQVEIRAVDREMVLAAAIYARGQWPEEYKETATSWADIILNHEAVLFNTKVCPLSREKVVAILSSAQKQGKPHKKN